MEAVDFGNSTGWGRGVGTGPWIMTDLENGLFAGQSAAAMSTTRGSAVAAFLLVTAAACGHGRTTGGGGSGGAAASCGGSGGGVGGAAARGARLAFVEYEAEAAATNGTVLPPSRTPGQLANESSGRHWSDCRNRSVMRCRETLVCDARP
jgi:hypothetical protein